MAEDNKKIRIKDIAQRAGVSTGTVDRVLHNRGDVNPETRKKVMDIVEEIGYSPNLVARSLASKKIVRIVVLFPDSLDNNPFWEQPVAGIQKGINELKDYNVQIELATFNVTKETTFETATASILKNKPDGVVFNPLFKNASLAFIKQLNHLKIPYIFFDINLPHLNNLSYFGQDAFKSGEAAARLMCNAVENESKLLLINLANNKKVSHHLKTRGEGFKSFFNTRSQKSVEIITVDIDLLDPSEPASSLASIYTEQNNIAGIFAPNSRVFKIANYLQAHKLHNKILIGYDIIEENIDGLNNGSIDFLICQKPEEQAYKAIMAMFNFLISGKETLKMNYSPIDVIFKENLEFYKTTK